MIGRKGDNKMKTIKTLLALLLLAGTLGLSTQVMAKDVVDTDYDPFDTSIHRPW